MPGPPEPPIKVELCDWDVDHMDLQWGFPPSDGGAPILHYLVEMRNIKEEDKWIEVGQSEGAKKFFQQTGLTKGEKYSFRVYSVNKAGKSGPSDPTPWAVAKPRKCKYLHIITNNYKQSPLILKMFGHFLAMFLLIPQP